MNSTICEAIERKNKIQFFYEGGVRIVEPFCFGFNARGNEMLRAYQTGGFSQSGTANGWRMYNVAKMNNIEVLTENFSGGRPDYNPYEKQMVRIYCNVK